MGHGGPSDYKRDLKLEALAPVVRGQLPVLVFADRARDIRNAIEFCDKQKLKMILAGGSEAYKVKDLLRSKGIPVILRPTLTLPVEEDDPYDRLLSQPAELAEAGVKFALEVLTILSRAGSATSRQRRGVRPAVRRSPESRDNLSRANFRAGGSGRHIGAGKIANIIVTNGDPLELTTDVQYLFIKGQRTSLDNRHLRLYEKYSNRPKAGRRLRASPRRGGNVEYSSAALRFLRAEGSPLFPPDNDCAPAAV